MKMPVFSVKDNLIGFGTPFTAINDAVACRGFTNSIYRSLEGGFDDTSTPEDLALYRIGDFDTELGVLSPCEPHPLVYGHVLVTEYRVNSCNCSNCIGGEIDGSKEV